MDSGVSVNIFCDWKQRGYVSEDVGVKYYIKLCQ